MRYYWLPLVIIIFLALYTSLQFSQIADLLSSLSGEENEEEFVPKTVENGGLITPTNFSEALPRWNHMSLKVYIDQDFPQLKPSYVDDVRSVMSRWESSSNLISFRETANRREADIVLKWVNNLKVKSLDSVGDTVLEYVDTGLFRLIGAAEIQLLTKENGQEFSDFDTTNIALHEFGHALGLSHSADKDSIMYPQIGLPSQAVKNISALDLERLEELYQSPVRPDLVLAGANATKLVKKILLREVFLLNINITVRNDGLIEADNSTLLIKADGNVIKETTLPAVEIGGRLMVYFENLEAKNNFERVEVIIDPVNALSELNEGNNKLILGLQ